MVKKCWWGKNPDRHPYHTHTHTQAQRAHGACMDVCKSTHRFLPKLLSRCTPLRDTAGLGQGGQCTGQPWRPQTLPRPGPCHAQLWPSGYHTFIILWHLPGRRATGEATASLVWSWFLLAVELCCFICSCGRNEVYQNFKVSHTIGPANTKAPPPPFTQRVAGFFYVILLPTRCPGTRRVDSLQT